MAPKSIFYPVFALVVFTFLVAARMFLARVAVMGRKRISTQALADNRTWDEMREADGPSDAFENLFEVPVLFYAVTLAVFVTGQADRFFVVMAWFFVLFRVIQGSIHCTSNRIAYRATAFWFGCIALMVMWVRFVILLAQGS